MALNDQKIRSALKSKLQAQAFKPRDVIEELQVCNGNAIADLVALYKEAHCYEIKGSGDKIERILTQGQYYNYAFRKITLVTTENHIGKALSICPACWGVMVAFESRSKGIKIRHVRGAKINPDFCKKVAALTLWKSEMLSILKEERYKRKTRDFLAQLISTNMRKAELSSVICESLTRRTLKRVVR